MLSAHVLVPLKSFISGLLGAVLYNKGRFLAVYPQLEHTHVIMSFLLHPVVYASSGWNWYIQAPVYYWFLLISYPVLLRNVSSFAHKQSEMIQWHHQPRLWRLISLLNEMRFPVTYPLSPIFIFMIYILNVWRHRGTELQNKQVQTGIIDSIVSSTTQWKTVWAPNCLCLADSCEVHEREILRAYWVFSQESNRAPTFLGELIESVHYKNVTVFNWSLKIGSL